MSLRPLFFNSLRIESQYFDDSASPIYIPRTSFTPSLFVPKTIYAALFFTIPESFTEK